MSTILSKKEMSEEDIKLQYITPAITSKWDRGKITMETQVTDGKINLKGNFVFREKPKRADYILYLNANNPIAIIEAKDNKHSMPNNNSVREKYNSYELESMAINKGKMVAVYNTNVSLDSGLAARDRFMIYHTIDFI